MMRLPFCSPFLPSTTLFRSLAVLSGPSFAQEVYARQPTAVVAAAGDHAVAQRVQHVFSTGYFRVYSAKDMIGDRKSTRLNSSHVEISYAVFCLKKKKS